jgi:BirA family biotin operon repressor/biotin-[acetyl-CoA-carboxylase] ligase
MIFPLCYTKNKFTDKECTMTDIQWRDTAPLIPHLSRPAVLSRVRWAKVLGSTNDVLKAAPDLPHGAIVAADAQSAGRGRMGRAFFSPKDSGLYLSVRYRTADNPALADFVTMGACAVSLQAVEKAAGITPKIKWVNDLMIGPKKIAGILTEGRADPALEKQWIVVGIGLNLFDPSGGFPDDIAARAGSITGMTATAYAENGGDPDDLRTRLLAAMIDGLTDLGQAESPASYADIYRRHSNLIGRAVTLTGAGEPIVGTVTGFDDFGHLKLQMPDGTSKLIRSGELTLRPL